MRPTSGLEKPGAGPAFQGLDPGLQGRDLGLFLAAVSGLAGGNGDGPGASAGKDGNKGYEERNEREHVSYVGVTVAGGGAPGRAAVTFVLG